MSAPKWMEVRDALAEDIRAGIWPVGSRIPSPLDLVTRFDADRNTIRRATTYLRDIGVLRTAVGSGTYVAALPPDVLPELPHRASLEERVTELEARAGYTEAALQDLAGRLGVPGGGRSHGQDPGHHRASGT